MSRDVQRQSLAATTYVLVHQFRVDHERQPGRQPERGRLDRLPPRRAAAYPELHDEGLLRGPAPVLGPAAEHVEAYSKLLLRVEVTGHRRCAQ